MTPTVGIKRNNSTSPDISDRPDKRLRQTEDVTDTETESEEIGALKYPVEPSSNESQVRPYAIFFILLPSYISHPPLSSPHNIRSLKVHSISGPQDHTILFV